MLNGRVNVSNKAIPDKMYVGNIATKRRSSPSNQRTSNESFLKENDTRVVVMYICLKCSKFYRSRDAANIPRDDMNL